MAARMLQLVNDLTKTSKKPDKMKKMSEARLCDSRLISKNTNSPEAQERVEEPSVSRSEG